MTTDNDFKSLDKHSARQVPTICKTVKSPRILSNSARAYRVQDRRKRSQRSKQQKHVAWLLPCMYSQPRKVCTRPAARTRTPRHSHTHIKAPQVKCWRTNIIDRVYNIFKKMIKLWKGEKLYGRQRLSNHATGETQY